MEFDKCGLCSVHLHRLKGQFHKVFGCFVTVSLKNLDCKVYCSGIVTGKKHEKMYILSHFLKCLSCARVTSFWKINGDLVRLSF